MITLALFFTVFVLTRPLCRLEIEQFIWTKAYHGGGCSLQLLGGESVEVYQVSFSRLAYVENWR